MTPLKDNIPQTKYFYNIEGNIKQMIKHLELINQDINDTLHDEQTNKASLERRLSGFNACLELFNEQAREALCRPSKLKILDTECEDSF